MSEFEIGEYVRTKNGNIDKIKTIICNDYPIPALRCCIIIDDENSSIIELQDILKHSKNITDLIEDTDILQVEISEEWAVKEDAIKFIIVGQRYTTEEIKEALENGMYKIQKILTKEQFKQNCYEVKGE